MAVTIITALLLPGKIYENITTAAGILILLISLSLLFVLLKKFQKTSPKEASK